MPFIKLLYTYSPGVILFSYNFIAIPIPSTLLPSSSFLALRLLLYPLFLLIAKNTLASSFNSICAVAALDLNSHVSKVVFFPFSARIVSLLIIPELTSTSLRLSLLSLNLSNDLLAPRFRVLSALVVKGLPFSKLICSSTVKGFTRTPICLISD